MSIQTKQPSTDYSLTGANAALAIEKGLAEADWYTCRVPRETLRKLLERKNGPAIRDTSIWLGLIIGCGIAAASLWGSWWALIPLMIYGVLYASSSDSRWHESSHGTAFKTDWMNNALYELASFMVMRESTVWRWSHNRHHSDTIIVGRDPEIAVPRPPNLLKFALTFLNIPVYQTYFKSLLLHATGRMNEAEKTFIPESEFPKVYRTARISLLIYLVVIALALGTHSIFPLLLVGLTNLYGSWLMPIYGLTQHVGLAEDVLDHRLNCRTVRMNLINRYLYWNMNYHIEHHMFPLVPYHALPKLHDAIKDDCPAPYPNTLTAWKEIISALFRQLKDPTYYVERTLPDPKPDTEDVTEIYSSDAEPDAEGWVEVCRVDALATGEVIRFDHGRKTYALVRTEDNHLYATDGICTHGNNHLADGFVKKGMIECAKHNGRFNLTDGSPARAPICRGLATYPLEERLGLLWVNVEKAGGVGAREPQTFRFRVVSNRNVSTFIKELELAPIDANIDFTPGDYIQLNIPTYETISFNSFLIDEPFKTAWEAGKLFNLESTNSSEGIRNNYSIASNGQTEDKLRFNIRISTPPAGQDCPPGIGSSYVFNLKEGDEVTAIGPFGDFHIKPTQKEMVYIGGGAGMAPLRAHLSHLLETEHTARKVSFWYGARSKQEIFYEDYFNNLAEQNRNFDFHIALSEALKEDQWDGPTGFIHEVVYKDYLQNHPNPKSIEFYLCGPPIMVSACKKMLAELGVDEQQIAFDEF